MCLTLFYKWVEKDIIMEYSFSTKMLIPPTHILKKFNHDSSNWGKGLYLPKHHQHWSLRDLQAHYYYITRGYKVNHVRMRLHNLNCIDYMLRKKYKPAVRYQLEDKNHPGMLCDFYKLLKSKEPFYHPIVCKYIYPKERIKEEFKIMI